MIIARGLLILHANGIENNDYGEFIAVNSNAKSRSDVR